MGASKSRKRAQENQLAAFNSMQNAARNAEAARTKYMNEFSTRNAGLIGMQNRAFERMKGFEAGQDVGKMYAGLSGTLNAGADTVRNTQRLTSGMGSNALAQQDPRYMAKLQAVGNRQIASQIGRALGEGAMQMYTGDVNKAMQATQLLNADQLAGLGEVGKSVGDWGNVGEFSTQIRKMEMERSKQIFNNIVAGINTAMGVVTGISGVANAGKLAGAAGGGGIPGLSSLSPGQLGGFAKAISPFYGKSQGLTNLFGNMFLQRVNTPITLNPMSLAGGLVNRP